jgi:F-type H+-transporting ATPase subunit delta
VRAALQKATGKTVRLSTKVDPSLLGGLVAKVGGTVYDSSIRTRLEQLKHNLIAQEVAVA